MGKCCDCVHYDYEGIDYKRDCYVKHWCNTLKMKVDPNASCNKFIAKATPSNSGYTGGSGSSCFLTSAMVGYYGKADDCEELTVLRTFRDGYMKTAEDGEELIKEYYAIAPEIVERINSCDKKDKYYKYISETVEKCVKLIALKENERALIEYKFMVENLKKEFAI